MDIPGPSILSVVQLEILERVVEGRPARTPRQDGLGR